MSKDGFCLQNDLLLTKFDNAVGKEGTEHGTGQGDSAVALFVLNPEVHHSNAIID